MRLLQVLLLAMGLMSCVHEWDDDEPLPEPALKQVLVRLDFHLELPPYKDIYYNFEANRSPEKVSEPDIVYTIMVMPENPDAREPLYKFVYSRKGAVPGVIDQNIEVLPGKYRFLVWAAYARPGTYDDLHYNTEVWSDIHLDRDHYSGCDDTRDCFQGRVEQAVEIPETDLVVIDMIRPLGKYRIISTDFDNFLDSRGISFAPTPLEANDAPSNGGQGVPGQAVPGFNPDDYYIMIRYAGYVPSAFNLYTNRPSDATLGLYYRGEFNYLGGSECEIGFDYVFVNGIEATVDVIVQVFDRDNNCLASSPSMKVPLVRSQLTTISGQFLTSQSNGSIGVNPDFDGEYNIIIN